MTTRETIRAAMADGFEALPEWLKTPFVPLRAVVTLLLDRGDDELARETVAAMPLPAEFTTEQGDVFVAARAQIVASIDALIADTAANDPLRSPEAIAMAQLAAERRAQG